MINFIKSFAKKTIMFLGYALRSRKRRMVFFNSFNGTYSDSPRAISEEMHKLAPEVMQVWAIRRHSDNIPSYIRIVSPSSVKGAFLQGMSNAWVLSGTYSKNRGIYKGGKTYYVQTWHGDRAIKQVGYAAKKSMGENYSRHLGSPDLSNCNLYIAGSVSGENLAHEAFLYDGEFLTVGMPRNDKLVNLEHFKCEAESLKDRLGIAKGCKVLLYAPTFRDKLTEKQLCFVDLAQVINALETRDGQWVCLIRSHSLSKGINIGQNDLSVLDVSDYPDMADLLMITDLLITDYSSCATDFVLTGRPVILAHFDIDDYVHESRTLNMNPQDIGFLIAKNQDELNKLLSNLHAFDHSQIAKNVLSYYKANETGRSSEVVARKILENIM